MEPWANRKSGDIETKYIPNFLKYGKSAGRPIYYRIRDGLVEEICLGERYVHISPGLLFTNEHYRGSYIDNWHGGPSGSLTDMIEWIAQAEHPGYGHDLWMIDESKMEQPKTLADRVQAILDRQNKDGEFLYSNEESDLAEAVQELRAWESEKSGTRCDAI